MADEKVISLDVDIPMGHDSNNNVDTRQSRTFQIMVTTDPERKTQVKFELNEKQAALSKLLKEYIDAIQETNIPPYELPAKNALLPATRMEFCVGKLVDFLKARNGIESQRIQHPIPCNVPFEELVDEADAKFLKPLEDDFYAGIFDMTSVSEYFQVTSLAEITTARIAYMIRGRQPQYIREKFGIINDFTPEEEEAVAAENKWAEES